MNKSFLALFFLLLTLASQGTWCAAERSHRISVDHLRPHLEVEELHVTQGKEVMEIQVPRKLGRADDHTYHDEVKVPKRMAIAHKGGSTGGAAGGGVAETRPHNGKNSAAAVPIPAKTSILALAFTCAIVLSAFSF